MTEAIPSELLSERPGLTCSNGLRVSPLMPEHGWTDERALQRHKPAVRQASMQSAHC